MFLFINQVDPEDLKHFKAYEKLVEDAAKRTREATDSLSNIILEFHNKICETPESPQCAKMFLALTLDAVTKELNNMPIDDLDTVVKKFMEK